MTAYPRPRALASKVNLFYNSVAGLQVCQLSVSFPIYHPASIASLFTEVLWLSGGSLDNAHHDTACLCQGDSFLKLFPFKNDF